MAEGRPDLAQEPDHRGLAVGTGDRSYRRRLTAEETRCHLRKPALRIIVEQHRERCPVDRLCLSGPQDPRCREHRRCASPHRIVDKVAALGAAAGQRREQKTGLHLPRVGGEPGDVGAGDVGGFQSDIDSQHEIS